MTASLKQRLRDGDLLIGTIVCTGHPSVPEMLAGCGFDWLFLDAEHGAFDPAAALTLLQAAASCPCLIRIPAPDSVWIKKALDIGAAGIIVPFVENAAQVRQMVAAAKYPPAGNRGIGLGRAHGYGLKAAEYFQQANDATLVVVQAETRAAVENIEAIAKVEGVDCVFIGPSDLSASYGKLGRLDDPEVRAAIDRVASACAENRIALGIYGNDAQAVNPWIRRGIRLIAVGMDYLFLIGAAKASLAQIERR